MGYMVLGFLLGVAVSWFWQRQFSGVPVFQKLLQKELAVNGHLGSLNVIKKRLDFLEHKLSELEKGDGESVEGEQAAVEPGALTGTKEPVKDTGKVVKPLRPVGTKIDRQKVLAMWKEGKSAEDIAAGTRMGRAEVELILSLKDRLIEKKG